MFIKMMRRDIISSEHDYDLTNSVPKRRIVSAERFLAKPFCSSLSLITTIRMADNKNDFDEGAEEIETRVADKYNLGAADLEKVRVFKLSKYACV